MSYHEQRERIFASSPELVTALKPAQDSQAAREALESFVHRIEITFYHEHTDTSTLKRMLQRRCIQTFRQIISKDSEEKTGNKLVDMLWNLAREQYDACPLISDGFVEEMVHLLAGITGKAHLYDQDAMPAFLSMTGREAARARSDELDRMATANMDNIRRYPSGLDDAQKTIRQENKQRILKTLDASEEDWQDYKWHLRHVVRTVDQLASLIDLSEEEYEAVRLARENKFPFGITPYYVSLMDKASDRCNDHAVRAQVIPPLNYVRSMLSHREDMEYSCDFMHEHDTSPIDLITRRYPQIVIFKPYNTCSQICVYCQRNWEIDDVLAEGALATRDRIEAAIQWLREHPAVNEVLITGGDPLVMNDNRLEWILSEIADIDHVERIRIGSRTPVVLPMRMTDSLVDIIARLHQPGRREIALVTHFEHPFEVTPEAMQAVQSFKKEGISIYNQAVFTLENSRRFELSALRRLLRLIGVDPYYSFNTKGKEETRNYRVPIARLQQEIKEEARRFPGLVRTDEAVYNVPRLGKNYLRSEQRHRLLTILPTGSRMYEFLPWETNMTLTETYIDTDVPIYDYLQELERRGEDPEEYRSIWYYY